MRKKWFAVDKPFFCVYNAATENELAQFFDNHSAEWHRNFYPEGDLIKNLRDTGGLDMKKEKIGLLAALAVMSFTAAASVGCTAEDQDLTSMSNAAGQITFAAEGEKQPGSTSPYITAFDTASPGARLLSSYSTSFKGGAQGRRNNIALAAKALNGKIIAPGETFSYNDTVGPTSKRRGFSLARIFVQGKELKGYGGGVCQVSSTLYNAVLGAGLEVVERHPHSKKVYYVPDNMDAATSYGGIDFKFRNNLQESVKLSATVTNEDVTVNIDVI